MTDMSSRKKIGLATVFFFVSIFLLAGRAQALDFWLEEFATGSPGAQPGGWYDETNDSNNNAEIFLQNPVGYVSVSTTGASWGKVLSFSQSVDIDTYDKLDVNVSNLENGTYKIAVFIPSPWAEHIIPTSISSSGVATVDIPTLTGLSGTITMGVELIVEGPTCSLEVDSIRIYQVDPPTMTSTQTPVYSPTPTLTATLTSTPSPVFTFTTTPTASPTSSPTPIFSPTTTPTASPTSTQTPDYTMTPTVTVTVTSTPYSTIGYEDQFDTPGAPPSGWNDETVDPGLDVYMEAVGGYAYLTITGASYGKVVSNLITLDTDVHQYAYFDVAEVAPSSGVKFSIFTGGTEYPLTGTPAHSVPGVYSFNYVEKVRESISWTGTQSFNLYVWFEGGDGKTAALDSIEISSLSPTPTPVSTNIYFENFDTGNVGTKPVGWRDDLNNTDFDTQILRSGASEAHIQLLEVKDPLEGKVLGPVLTGVDVTQYSELGLFVTDVNPGTRFDIQIQQEEYPNQNIVLAENRIDAGLYTFPIPLFDAGSNTQTMSVTLWLKNTDASTLPANVNLKLDYVRIGMESTATVTSTITATPVANTFRPEVNLFHPKEGPVRLHYGITDASDNMKITAYNMAGQKVREILSLSENGQVFDVVEWDGKNDQGEWVASGIYVIRFESRNFRKNIRLAVIR